MHGKHLKFQKPDLEAGDKQVVVIAFQVKIFGKTKGVGCMLGIWKTTKKCLQTTSVAIYSFQWYVKDFADKGAPNPKVGAPTYYFGHFPPKKQHKIEKKTLAPPWICQGICMFRYIFARTSEQNISSKASLKDQHL